jgi:hypothetical protein
MGLNQYTLPKLEGHNVLYKGKRFWIFEISLIFPFGGYENNREQVIVYDKVYGAPVACACKTADGFDGALTGTMDRVEVGGATLQDFLTNTIDRMRSYEKHCAGFISSRTARPYRRRETE